MIIQNVQKKYGNRIVLNDISLEFPIGKVISLIGPNGAGKSTLMGIISRLIQKDGGSVSFLNKELKDWNSRELAKNLAILTQSNNLQMKLTVQELVAFGRFPYTQGHLNEDDNKIIKKALSYMELEDIKDCFIDELSGGQRQRAFIAMVIAQDTDFVLLDEPTNNLDIYHATSLMRTVRRLCEELNKTVILVLHEINYASFYSDYIVAMKDGKIAAKGKVNEVIDKNILKAIYNVDFEIIEVNGKPMTIYY